MKNINLMTHIVAGYPTLKKSEEIAKTMIASGVKYLEIQIPFSDPVADGEVIRKANEESIKNGVKINDCFKLMKKLSQQKKVKLLFMTYYNIPFKYGLDKFCKQAKKVGCYGLIVPDMPYDQEIYDNFLETADKYGLVVIQIVAKITPEKRLKEINKIAKGFIYCVAKTGTTGTHNSLSNDLRTYIEKVKNIIKHPIALGFGISSKSQIKKASKLVDIIIIGSKLIKLYDKRGVEGVKKFLMSVTNN